MTVRRGDIAGAKALKERLGLNGTEEAPVGAVDVPEDAPPVYHWTGVTRPTPAAPVEGGDEPANGASLFSRLAFSFR